ncbi:peptidase C14 [Hysterangium stoloniferum]|nr:peptidase C14 [Hysterangium stoloniferum]
MFPASPRKKALCVGVSYKGQNGPYGHSADDFELVAAHSDVDKLAAMRELVAGAEAGDYLFFFFAGHGDQVTNHDGKEDDGMDEIILPIDWEFDPKKPIETRDGYTQIIIDDEMNEILVQNLPKDCRLTALFDSCHSGTMLDLPYERWFGPRSKSPPFERSTIFTIEPTCESPKERMPAHHEEARVYHGTLDSAGTSIDSVAEGPVDRAHISRLTRKGPLELKYVLASMSPRGRTHPLWRKGTWLLRGATRDEKITPPHEKGHAISWSSCSDGQNGYELKSKGGIMVKAFVDILREEPYRTYRDILECLGGRLKDACEKINKNFEKVEWIMQEPQLGSQQKPNLDNLFAP